MKIDREKLLERHNPRLYEIDTKSPLTVGNGELGFTADITGMQTLYDTYRELPLCTLSQWGWHTTPVSEERYCYTLDDLQMTEYDRLGRKVYYPKKRLPGSEEVYDWLRVNPHRLNLARIALFYNGKELKPEQIGDVSQELLLYKGILRSRYTIEGEPCEVYTACAAESDMLGFKIESSLVLKGSLSVKIMFPYGNPNITASDWSKGRNHHIEKITEDTDTLILKHILDRDTYYIGLHTEAAGEIRQGDNEVLLLPKKQGNVFAFTVSFTRDLQYREWESHDVFKSSTKWWADFWEKGGIVRLNRSKDPRANELERRIILSQYLMAVNSAGSQPPQETGLTCNSWYGKMHLEMYLWHEAWLPLWNHTDLLERSFGWYLEHIEEARENAARNQYKGARWPKMIASDGIDTPSAVAPLLIWQQPHIIFMLELAYQREPSEEFLKKYWILIKETTDFMVDYVSYDENKGVYNIPSPTIPVQECHRPEDTVNPAFEVEYWYVTIKIAEKWAKRLNLAVSDEWKDVYSHMAGLKEENGLYLAHEFCTDTFTLYNRDHPSMVGAYGLLNGRADKKIMDATLDKVLETWQYGSLWGWDFAMMAMTAVRLGRPDTAIDILLMDTLKNRYDISGNNRQESRKDLPLYLPGNGSLLLAIPMMTAGYKGCKEETPGFPKDGSWVVEYEGIMPFFE